MTDKTAKPKKAKKAKKADQPSVLASLPATRPSRIGVERGAAKARPASPTARRPAPRKTTSPPARPASTPRVPPRPPAPAPAGPRAVRAGAPKLETASERPAAKPDSVGPPSGGQLVSTAIQAAGELAQIGLTVGSQILKRAVDRLPKP